MGFKRWGLKQIRGDMRKKASSFDFWISQVLFGTSGEGRKDQKRGRKRPQETDFWERRPPPTEFGVFSLENQGNYFCEFSLFS